MVKLKEYIKKTLKEMNNSIVIDVYFDIGIDTDMNVNDESQNRIKFTAYHKDE